LSADFTIITQSPEETIKFGKDIAGKLNEGDVVAIYGDLGSGKTQIVKGICLGLGVRDTVNSPTFIIVNEYEAAGGMEIYHMDLYRMTSEDEVINIGFEDYMSKGGILIIEWPVHIERLLPANTIKIHIAHTNECDTCRYIKFSEIHTAEEKTEA
jgi:tRNA threonylcarbamoyladenosine biosynthesis protein TsaE